MSTVDVVVVAGGKPANFCDLGGGGTAEGVVDALEVITRDPQVRSIFFNIFGGITRCDEVARGMLVGASRPKRRRANRRADRRPLRRDERGGGAPDPGRLAGSPDIWMEPTVLEAARRAVEETRLAWRVLRSTATPELLVQGITGSEGRFHRLP